MSKHTHSHDLINFFIAVLVILFIFSVIFLKYKYYSIDKNTIFQKCKSISALRVNGDNELTVQDINGNMANKCEIFCQNKGMVCQSLAGKDCNIVTYENQYICVDENNEVHIFIEKDGIECAKDVDCHRMSFVMGGYFSNESMRKCIKNECVDLTKNCVKIVKTEFNMTNPECQYTLNDECNCVDYVIDSPRMEIKRGNSTQIIEEKGHFVGEVIFRLNN